MNKEKGLKVFFITLFSVFGLVVVSQPAHAAEDFSRGVVLTAKPNVSAENNRISSTVYADTLDGATPFNGAFDYFYAEANLQTIRLVYAVKGRFFTMSGRLTEPTFVADGKLLGYTIDCVDGRRPAFKTKVVLSKPSSTSDRQVVIEARNGLVPNWSALPHIQSYSKVQIYGSMLSVLPE